MPKALVAEPSLPISAALKKFLESARYEVQVVHFVDEAVQAVRDGEPDMVFASQSGTFDGETLCAKVKGMKPVLPVVLIYPPDEDQPDERSSRAHADAFLTGPLKRGAVVSTAGTMMKLRELMFVAGPLREHAQKQKQTVEQTKGLLWHAKAALEQGRQREDSFKAQTAQLQAEIDRWKKEATQLSVMVKQLQSAPSPAAAPPPTGGVVNDAEFFKRFLTMEVKRSKRYQYPVALLMVGLDRMEEWLGRASSAAMQRAAIKNEAMAVIGQVVRDVDMVLPFADDTYLVFLPHTPREGSLVVAGRLQQRLSKMDAFEGGQCSVGVAAFEPKVQTEKKVSFGELVKDASASLKRAQTSGGAKVEASEAPVKPKRDRISIG